MLKRISLFLAFMVAFTGTVSAADLYVSKSGGKNKNDGSKSAPLKNIWKAIEIAKDGDVIHVAEGNYNGKMSKGWIDMNKYVSLIGGYNKNFTERDIAKYQTCLRPSNKQNATKPTFGTLTIHPKSQQGKVVVDGLFIDHTDANSYHAVEGKPEGFKNGMYCVPPAKGTTKNPSIDKYQLHFDTNGEVLIQNCVFLNSAQHAIIGTHRQGQVTIQNNVFLGSRMAACDVRNKSNKKDNVTVDFKNNTVLFCWTRTKAFEDMGYGFRTEPNCISNVQNNILGLCCMTAFDNTQGDDRTKQVSVDNNMFFLNKTGDVSFTVSPNIQFMKVEDDGFEDLCDCEGVVSFEGNVGLSDPSVFKGIIDDKYLDAFLSATYSETAEYDENSPANAMRAALGLNKTGVIHSKVSMFANPYPADNVFKFFGAVKGVGAQALP